MLHTPKTLTVLIGLFLLAAPALQAKDLPRPDGEPADMSKPVKVFILMGQSNMVGAGKIGGIDKEGTLENAAKQQNLYPFLVDDGGNWAERKDVRYVRYMTGRLLNNDWMKVAGGRIGPEFGIGHPVGNVLGEPVMILKSCIGNRSLGWDLLPPDSESYEFQEQDKQGNSVTYVYAGYKQSPLRWVKGTEPKPIGWYAGKQYDTDVADAKKVLADLETYYPGGKGYEVAGFFYWQGDKDRYKAGHAAKYKKNLVHMIKTLRKDFNAPKAKFVCATLGQSAKDSAKGNDKLILDAQLAVDGETGKYPEFQGNVATVYTNPISQGGASNGHYGGNSRTYMDVGLAMGEAMITLLKQ
jgi:hypothetical protein